MASKTKKEKYASLFSVVDLDSYYKSLNNLYSPSELIKKIGGYSKFPLLYKDRDIRAAKEKREAALLDTKLVVEGPDQYLNVFD